MAEYLTHSGPDLLEKRHDRVAFGCGDRERSSTLERGVSDSEHKGWFYVLLSVLLIEKAEAGRHE